LRSPSYIECCTNEMVDELLLRERALIETINDQLKNICQIEHSRRKRLVYRHENIRAWADH
jgi:Transposase DDE domain